jgi:hypothetical protein
VAKRAELVVTIDSRTGEGCVILDGCGQVESLSPKARKNDRRLLVRRRSFVAEGDAEAEEDVTGDFGTAEFDRRSCQGEEGASKEASMHTDVLRRIESHGYATSLHIMGDYCELHAVPLPTGEPVFVSRVDGDGPEDLFVAACELARMVGVGDLK